MRQLKNENGSTLMLVIVFIGLITMMGVALITTSAAHMRVQKGQETRKAALYATESGLDDLIALLTENAVNAHTAALSVAEGELAAEITAASIAYEAFIIDQRSRAGEGPMPVGASVPIPALFEGSVNGTVNQSRAYERAESLYHAQFTSNCATEINSLIGIGNRLTESELLTSPFTIDDKVMVGIVLDDTADPTDPLVFTGDTLNLTLFSLYYPKDINTSGKLAENVSRKLLTVDVSINVPAFAPVRLDQTVRKFDPNILWTKALTTDRDIIVQSGNVQVFGNVYAFGNADGGITAGDTDTANPAAALTVNGEVVTNENVSFAESNSSITVNGNIYAGNAVIGNGLSNVRLTVARGANGGRAFTSYSMNPGSGVTGLADETATGNFGDLVTRGNLELRGASSQIGVSGSFIGFSDPLTGTQTDTNETSCIIVDADNPSSLAIGNDTVICGISNLTSSFDAGTDRFNTGESIALTGNYNAYKNILADLPGAGQNYFTQFDTAFRATHATDALTTQPMEYYNPLGLGLFAPLSYLGQGFRIFDYADYLFGVARMVTDPSIVDDDNVYGVDKASVTLDGGRVNINNDFSKYHSYGVGFADGQIIPRQPAEARLLRLQTGAETMFFGQTRSFGNLLDTNFFDGDTAEIQTISDQFTFGAFTSENEWIISGTGEENVIVSNNDVSVTGNAGETVRGVIVTRGNVTLSGNFNFRGTIIAGGSIIINGTVTITNDRDFIAKAMHMHGDGVLSGFTRSIEVLPTYSFKTVAGDASPITREDFVYTAVEDDDTGLTYTQGTIADTVVISNWRVREY